MLLHKPLVNSANPLIWSLCRNYSQNGVGFHPTLSVYRFPGQERSSVSVDAQDQTNFYSAIDSAMFFGYIVEKVSPPQNRTPHFGNF